jgi:pimeloyl-ACP methyl ester carboxylesterase
VSTQYLDVADGRIAYELTGPEQGALLVLVHGTGDTRKTYRFLVPQLTAAGYRVAAMDVRGYGESTAAWPDYLAASVGTDVVALIRHLGRPAIVIGHSIACASAVYGWRPGWSRRGRRSGACTTSHCSRPRSPRTSALTSGS